MQTDDRGLEDKPVSGPAAPGEERPGDRGAAWCPSCERYMGPVDVCPYCDADSRRAPVLRHLRWAALALVVAGLGLLWAMARTHESPVLAVSGITPMMNFARVRVAGTVAAKPYVSTDTNRPPYVSIELDDGTGRLRLVAYREVAQALAVALPAKGDTIEAEGTLDIPAGGKPRLRIAAAEDVKWR